MVIFARVVIITICIFFDLQFPQTLILKRVCNYKAYQYSRRSHDPSGVFTPALQGPVNWGYSILCNMLSSQVIHIFTEFSLQIKISATLRTCVKSLCFCLLKQICNSYMSPLILLFKFFIYWEAGRER